MRTGELLIWIGSGVILLFTLFVGSLVALKPPPVLYKVVETPLSVEGEKIYRREGCHACHQVMGNGGEKGPKLDAMGHLRTREWLKTYFAAKRPQDILPSKHESSFYAMPSLAALSRQDRDLLVEYMMSLQGQDPAHEEFYAYLKTIKHGDTYK